jgi:hypothetical protein
MEDHRKKGLKNVPSRTDPNDPGYSLKYVHNMPPLEAYKLHKPAMDLVSTETNTQIRYFFYGWNNLTEFEKKAIEDVKVYLKVNFHKDVPEGFSDRELLKFVQANFFDL